MKGPSSQGHRFIEYERLGSYKDTAENSSHVEDLRANDGSSAPLAGTTTCERIASPPTVPLCRATIQGKDNCSIVAVDQNFISRSVSHITPWPPE